MLLTFDQVAELLDEIIESFPPTLFEELNGGVNLLDEAVPDPEIPRLYTMGHYCHDYLGRYINLYYGSFAAMAKLEFWTFEDWKYQLRKTFAHELTHHMETRSGLHALDDQDAEEMAAWREERKAEDG